MRRSTTLKLTSLFLLISIGCLGILPLQNVNGQWNSSSYEQHDISPNKQYNFIMPYNSLPLLNFNITSNVSVNLTLGYNGVVSYLPRQLNLEVNNTRPIQLNITAEFNYESFLDHLPSGFNLTEFINAYNYNCFYHIYTNETVSNATIYFRNLNYFGFDSNKNYSLGVYKKVSSEWKETEIPLHEVKKDGISYLMGSFENLDNETDYYLTPYTSSEPQQPSSPVDWDWLIILIPGIIVVAVLSLVIAKKDYIKLLKRRIVSIDKGAHRLTMEEVLENKNRSKIIDIILKNPGIHFNELKRKSALASGNLVWHLDILETYKVIKKKRVKNYVIYIPYFSKNPLSNLDLKLQKSELTLEVLETILENPGIWNAKITDELETHRKTIQYHIDKLIELGLVYKKSEGRKKKIYPNLDAEYFREDGNKSEKPKKED